MKIRKKCFFLQEAIFLALVLPTVHTTHLDHNYEHAADQSEINYIHQNKHKSNQDLCSTTQYYDEEEGRCIGLPGGGNVRFIDYEYNCNDNNLSPHSSEKNYYYVCKSNKYILAECNEGQHFDNTLQKCIVNSPSEKQINIRLNQEEYNHIPLPPCTTSGRFPVPKNCTLFYMCHTSGSQIIQIVFACPPPTGYDPVAKICTYMQTCAEGEDGVIKESGTMTATVHQKPNAQCKGNAVAIPDTSKKVSTYISEKSELTTENLSITQELFNISEVSSSSGSRIRRQKDDMNSSQVPSTLITESIEQSKENDVTETSFSSLSTSVKGITPASLKISGSSSSEYEETSTPVTENSNESFEESVESEWSSSWSDTSSKKSHHGTLRTSRVFSSKFPNSGNTLIIESNTPSKDSTVSSSLLNSLETQFEGSTPSQISDSPFSEYSKASSTATTESNSLSEDSYDEYISWNSSSEESDDDDVPSNSLSEENDDDEISSDLSGASSERFTESPSESPAVSISTVESVKSSIKSTIRSSATTDPMPSTETPITLSDLPKDECPGVGVYRVPNSCSMFFECSSDGQGGFIKSEIKTCPRCLRFNQYLGACDYVENVPECSDGQSPVKNCTGEGTFRDSENLSTYYICTKTDDGHVLTTKTCPNNLVYNSQNKSCDHISNVKVVPKMNECSTTGFFAHPSNCQKFYNCAILDSNDDLQKMEMTCPPELIFDETREFCTYPAQIPEFSNITSSTLK